VRTMGRPGWLCVVVAALAVMVGAACSETAGAQASLPDGRGYELVSPPIKDGGDVLVRGTRTRTAADGNALAFTSLAAFGDIHGTGIASEYLSQRDGRPGTNGWSAHGLFPKLDPLSLNGAIADLDSSYQAEMSPDLGTGIFRTFTNLTGDPMVANVPNLYLRSDLRTPGLGSYDLLSSCPVCVTPLDISPGGPRPFVADTTPDFGHVLFETRYNLLPDASGGGPKLYDWDHGTLFLEGMLPAAEGGGAALRSIAGVGAMQAIYTLNTISDDGSKVFFTVPPSNAGQSGPLYMRQDHTTTVQLNASERTDCADTPLSCTGVPSPDPSGPLPVRYQIATPEGSKVIFTSDEQLTDVPGAGVYMYDTSLPDSDPHNLTLLSPDNDPATGASAYNVLGMSDDGSYVYFTANDQLISGQPETNGSDGIYVWHMGTLTYVGTLTNGDDAQFIDSIAHTWDLNSLGSRVTSDGTRLLLTSHSGSGLTGYDHGSGCPTSNGSCIELYLYDAPSNHLVCASCNPSGAPATADADFNLQGTLGGSRGTSHLVHALSSDGRYVFFTSGERLVPADRNGKTKDVYEFDSATGQVHLITSGRDVNDSYFLDASPNGRDVFFATRERLVGWDVDNNYDVYDARIGGGFPEPKAAVAECRGDTCQGALGSSPSPLEKLATGIPHANGNVTRQAHRKRHRCAHGKVRKRVHGKVKCVKRKRKAHHRASKGSR
jgi:hypothetical protein